MTVSGNGNFIMQDNNSNECIAFAEYLVDNNWWKDITRSDKTCWYSNLLNIYDLSIEQVYEKFKQLNN